MHRVGLRSFWLKDGQASVHVEGYQRCFLSLGGASSKFHGARVGGCERRMLPLSAVEVAECHRQGQQQDMVAEEEDGVLLCTLDHDVRFAVLVNGSQGDTPRAWFRKSFGRGSSRPSKLSSKR